MTLFLLIYFQVYTGVPKDYTKEFATNETFIKILLGEDIPYGSGKTLKTGPNDFVFVYFSDHGAKGIVAFGDNYLTAQTLNNVSRTIKQGFLPRGTPRFEKMIQMAILNIFLFQKSVICV